MPDCPRCHQPDVLVAVDLSAAPVGTAPWLCPYCSRGWFDAELAPDVAPEFTPLQDYGEITEQVQAAIAAEVETLWGDGVPSQ